MKNKTPTHAYLLTGLQVVFLILFSIFVRYSPAADAKFHPISSNATQHQVGEHHLDIVDENAYLKTYPFFQDVHVMVFVGIGFLMTYLKRYGFSAVGLNFLVGATCLEWAILVNGFFHMHHGAIYLDLNSLLAADFIAATVLISFGAVLGKTTPTQLIIMAVIEVPVFTINEVIGRKYFGAIDIGDSMYIHIFAAYFGLGVSFMLRRPDASTSKEASSYRSDLAAMVGTIFLWLYWPSFNSSTASGDDQLRAIINTYLSLCSCCLTSFAISSLVHPERKFSMVHVQNSTLAGGVVVGAVADLMIHPWLALLAGMIAGIVSSLGYSYVTPFLASKLKLHDSCGIHNLHGMPGLVSGILGVIMAAVATESEYGASLYQIFPARTPEAGSEDFERLQTFIPDLKGGPGISAGSQALYQFLALILSVVLGIVGGVVSGFILRLGPLQELDTDDLYEDTKYWVLEEGEDSGSEVDGITFPQKQSFTVVREPSQ